MKNACEQDLLALNNGLLAHTYVSPLPHTHDFLIGKLFPGQNVEVYFTKKYTLQRQSQGLSSDNKQVWQFQQL